ncbi:hypothetical protein D3C87_2183430 [compost metagenome]
MGSLALARLETISPLVSLPTCTSSGVRPSRFSATRVSWVKAYSALAWSGVESFAQALGAICLSPSAQSSE